MPLLVWALVVKWTQLAAQMRMLLSILPLHSSHFSLGQSRAVLDVCDYLICLVPCITCLDLDSAYCLERGDILCTLRRICTFFFDISR
jgi:hypothetical protein